MLRNVQELIAQHQYYDRHGTDLKVKKGVFSVARAFYLKSQQSSLKESANHQEVWGLRGDSSFGDYSSVYNAHLNPSSLRMLDPSTEGSFSGNEIMLKSMLETQLHTSSSDKPVIAVDVGGMYGLSWIKLARHFHTDIEAQKLILYVTNLHFDTTKAKNNTTTLGGQEIQILSDKNIKLWRQFYSLIKFINISTVNDLPSNIDLIHEEKSVSYHSLFPARERIIMCGKLSRNGMYMTSDFVSPAGYSGIREFGVTIEEIKEAKKQEIQAFNQAVANSFQFHDVRSVSINGQEHELINPKLHIFSRKNQLSLT